MKLHAHRYYLGPNVHSRHPGLALHLEPEDGDTFWKWRPSIVEAAALLDDLRSLFPATVDAAEPDDAARIAQAPTPAAELIMIVVAGLVHDYCADPARGRLVDDAVHGAHRVVLFLPCEDIGIAVNAWGLASRVPEIFHAATQPDDGQQRTMSALRDAYWAFRGQCLQLGLNQSNIALARAAVARGIPHYRLGGRTQTSQFGQGRHRQRIFETLTEKTGGVARQLVRDKLVTGALLAASGVPTPGSRAVGSEQDAIRVAREFGGLVVVKPRSSGKGKGVTVRLRDDAEIAAAFRAASQHGAVIVERFVEGEEHRMLVVAGRLVGVGQRQPGAVTGDGVRTVRELVEALNRDPRRGLPFERALQWLKFDDEAHRLLAAQNLTESSIPARDQQVRLRGASNLSRGGNALDLTDVTHPDNRALMERIARMLGLDVVGLDFLTPDVRRSWREVPCAILEANTTPGLGPHMTLDGGRGVSAAIVAHLFPGESEGRIPTVTVTGGAGRELVCRIAAHLLACSGSVVALSTAQGAFIGTEAIHRGDAAVAPTTLTALLHDPVVDAAVFEAAPKTLAQRGMFLDRCDVGVVLPADSNDVAPEGLLSLEALAQVTGVVAANARDWIVRDADDARASRCQAPLRSARLCLVSTRVDSAALDTHRASGGRCVLLDLPDGGSRIVIWQDSVAIARIDPCARVDRDVLFAVAAAYALGVAADVIERGLATLPAEPV